MPPDNSSGSLSSISYQILLALAARDRHGYAIRQAIEAQTGGSVSPGAGTLSAAVRRLEDEGLIEESKWRPEADRDDQRRRYYRLSTAGRTALRAETERMRATVQFALKQLKTRPAR
jgi:DNA-binding PadR family transcriptional regulator